MRIHNFEPYSAAYLVDLESQSVRERIEGIGATHTAYSSKHNALMIGRSDGTVMTRNLTVTNSHAHAEPVTAGAISPDDHWAATGDAAGGVHVWPLREIGAGVSEPAKPPKKFGEVDAIRIVTFANKSSNMFTTANMQGQVSVWSFSIDSAGKSVTDIKRLLQDTPVKGGRSEHVVRCMSFSPDDGYIAVTRPKRLTILRIGEDARDIAMPESLQKASLQCAGYAEDGRLLVIASDGSLYEATNWHGRNGSPLDFRRITQVNKLRIVQAQIGRKTGKLVVLDPTKVPAQGWIYPSAAGGQPIPVFGQTFVSQFSKDETRLATSSVNGEVTIWDTEVGAPVMQASPAEGFALSASGQWLLSMKAKVASVTNCAACQPFENFEKDVSRVVERMFDPNNPNRNIYDDFACIKKVSRRL